MSKKRRSIRDIIHDYIYFSENEEKVIETRIFQRLRNISQTAMASLTYPSLRGSRFEHSIGTMHLAGRMIDSLLDRYLEGDETDYRDVTNFVYDCSKELVFIWDSQNVDIGKILQETSLNSIRKENCSEVTISIKEKHVIVEEFCDIIVNSVRMTGLLHDIGHLPFSHQAEDALSPKHVQVMLGKMIEIDSYHEYITLEIIKHNGELKIIPEHIRSAVISILTAKEDTALYALRELISGELDADRGDSILRDGAQVGTNIGHYDISRLIDSLNIAKWKNPIANKPDRYVIRPSKGALSVVEQFLSERYNLRKWVYYHHYVKFADTAFSHVLKWLLDLSWLYGVIEGDIQLGDSHKKATQTRFWNRQSKEFQAIASTIGNLIPLTRFTPENLVSSNILELDEGTENSATPTDDIWLIDVFRKVYFTLSRNDLSDLPMNLKEMKALLGCILYREKRSVPIWRQHMEYIAFDDEMIVPRIQKIAKNVHDKRRKDSLRTSGDEIGRINRYLTSPKIRALNHLIDNYIDDMSVDSYEELENYINRIVHKNIGDHISAIMVKLKFGPLKPVSGVYQKEDEFTITPITSDAGFIFEEFDGSKRVISLLDASPVFEGLVSTWNEDIHFYVFGVFLGEHIPTYAERVDVAGKIRSMLPRAIGHWFRRRYVEKISVGS